MLMSVLVAVGITIVLFAILAVIVSMQPAAFRVSRSTTVAAPPATVFSHVNDLHSWEAWSPFEKLDKDMKRTYEGPPAGVGAKQSWSGNNKAGEGSMTITESRPNDYLAIKLEFKRPFQATNLAEFTFEADAGQTNVTWAMSGERNFVMKAFGMFMSMDKMLGGAFEEGLANLKKVVESTVVA